MALKAHKQEEGQPNLFPAPVLHSVMSSKNQRELSSFHKQIVRFLICFLGSCEPTPYLFFRVLPGCGY